MIRVLLADDQALVRSGFRMLLEPAPDIDIIGEASTGRQAVSMARSLQADVVLMDIRMPDTDGLEATQMIATDEDLAGVRVVILTTYEADDYVFKALRAGASGFLTKDVEVDDLLRAIRVVANGDALLSPSITRRLIARVTSQPDRPQMELQALSALTDREKQVLQLVATGLSNGEIAGNLYLSPLTVKTHVSRIMTKLDARDRAQLVVYAYEHGVVSPRF